MNTPIVDFVKKYADSDSLRLHMPGHKGNAFLGCEKFDITEIGGADVLYSADGIIAESQQNATKLFGTKATLYSTEGSSLCIRAMLYLVKSYARQFGKKPIIAAGRNAHKTFVTAASLLNLDVDWLLPNNTQTVISCVITANYLDNYLQTAREKPVAVYITSPDYLGNITDIKALSAICRKHGVLLLVDNAHGAYLKFLPTDSHPITLGADMCCDSAHKTLPVLTGGAYLHIGKDAPDFFAQNAQKALGLFASTSPSYLILQSLDMVNRYISDGFADRLAEFIFEVNKLKADLVKMGYQLCGDESLKLTILSKPYGYTGYELSDILLKNNIVCEFSDPDYVVLMLTFETNMSGLERLKKALSKIAQKTPIADFPPVPTLKKVKMSLGEVLYAPRITKKAEDCLGKISASTDAACPPAIPIVLPGEVIDEDTIKCFNYYGIKEWYVIE
ncbi:MAG: aminotransferase class V-fold PLP-dependent enzyme [Clostridia bacterium]|nr:aminotransferase class V-fold PLP-dependent enzyme [Clostridia bacterium]